MTFHPTAALRALLAVCTAALLASLPVSTALAQQKPTIIELTQVPCQFLEPERGIDRKFTSQRAEDCNRINGQTAVERLAQARTLVLKPGSYIFRVENKNVPYELGFWLRGDGAVNRALLPSVSGGGLATGSTKDYFIDLRPGTYVYSCPLNPTPDYKLVVKG